MATENKTVSFADSAVQLILKRLSNIEKQLEVLPEIGMTLGQIFGVAAVDQITLLTAANAGLVTANTAATQEIAELNAANSALANELADKQAALDQSQAQLLAVVGEVTRLGAALEQANALISALRAEKAAQAPAVTTAEAPSDEPA